MSTFDRSTLEPVQREIIARIRDDRRFASHEIAAILDLLERSLFKQDVVPGRLLESLTSTGATLWEFRERFGLDVGDYLDRRRYEAAWRLLSETEVPVAEVAAGLGYADPGIFSKWIKRRTGFSPTQLRAAAAARPRRSRREPSQPTAVLWRQTLLAGVESAAWLTDLLRTLYPRATA